MRYARFSLFLAGLSVLVTLAVARGQDDAGEASSDPPTAAGRLVDRYLQILLRRPSLGTALDKVYEYHDATESLEGLIEKLQQTDGLSDEEIGRQQFAIGLLQLKAGSADAAITALQSAAATLTDDAMVSFYLGEAQTRAGNDEAATVAYQQAVDRGPPRNAAAEIFLELGKRYQQQGDAEQAEAIWTELARRFPDDLRIGERIARAQAAAGDFEAAGQRFEALAASAKAVGNAEKAIEFAIQAAELQGRNGESERARAAFQSLLAETRPGSYLHNDLQRRLESSLRESNDPAALIEYYEKQVSENPDEVAIRLRYAGTLFSLTRYEQAAEVYREAIERAPSNVEARQGLIAALRADGKIPEALAQYRSLAERDRTNPDHMIQWGELVLHDETIPIRQRRRRAAEIWTRLSDQRSDDPVLFTQLANRLRAIGHDEEALQLYQDAIALAPDQPEYREYLGEYLFDLNRTDEAVETWKEIAAGNREGLQTLVRLAEVFESFGLIEQVIETIARVSQYDPAFPHRLQFASMFSAADEFELAFEQIELAAAAAESSQQEDRARTVEIDLLLRSGRLPDAIEQAEAMVEKTPRDALAIRRLALLQRAAGRWSSALENIERSVAQAPDNIRVLSTAVAIFEEAFRLDEAVAVLQQLADLDRPSRFEHLSKAAQLQLRLGRVDEALATGQRRIDLNPSSAASYQAFAELCFTAVRDEQAIEALQKALQFDPRNNRARQRLASTLAEQYQTDQAIELYWQAFKEATDLDERLDFVGLMTPLHQRIGRFSSLIDRLTTARIPATEAGPAERALLIAAAHEAAGDIEVALDHLEESIAGTSPQPPVLKRIIQLALLTDDVQRAMTYQRRLLDLDDTSENRKRLLTLALRSQNAEDRRDAVERLCRDGDESIVINAMDDALRRGQFWTVVELGDTFVPLAGADWEVPGQLRLAIASCGDGAAERTDRLVDELRERIAAKKPLFPAKAIPDHVQEAPLISPRQRALQLAPQLSVLLQVGDPGQCPIVEAPTASLDLAELRTPQQLAWLIDAIAFANSTKHQPLNASEPTAEKSTERTSDHNGDAAWSSLLRAQADAIFGGTAEPSQQDGEADWQRHLWELVQSGDATALDAWLTWLRNRQALLQSDGSGRERLHQNPLTGEQLDWLRKDLPEAVGSLPIDMHIAIYHELLWSDRRDAAEAYIAAIDELAEPSTLTGYLDAQRFFFEVGQTDRACAIMSPLREALTNADRSLAPERLDRMTEQTVRCANRLSDRSDRWETLQLLLTIEQRRMRQVSLIPSASESNESLVVYRHRGDQSTLQTITGPISSRLVRPTFLEAVYQLAVNAAGADEASAERFADRLCELPQQSAASRSTAAGGKNRKSGQGEHFAAALPTIAAFFIQTWTKDWSAAEETLAVLQDRFPDSPALQLEQARLLETQGERERAISVLATVRPGDPQTLQKRDLRMVRLASYAGQPARAREAADRLSVMPIDTATQLTLVGQLKRMRLDDLADAVLQRVRRQSAEDSSTLLDVAFAYEEQNRPDQAAEAAFDVIRHDQRNTVPSPEMIRAVRLLHSLERLDPLIAQLEQRAAAAGEPLRLLRQLSKIYQVAGLHEKMLAVEAKITEREPNNAQAQAQLASIYVTTNQYHPAVDRFLVAFQIDPTVMTESWQDFERAVQMSDRADAALAGLLEAGIDRIPETVMKQLSRFSLFANRRPGGALSAPTAEFYRQLLASQTPEELIGNLETTREHAGAATAELAAAPLRKLFEDPDTYASDSPIWNHASEIIKGVFHGGLDSLLDTLNDDPELLASIRAAIDPHRSETSSQPMADALLAAVEWESGDRQQARERLRSHLTNPASELAPALVWQMAQRWQTDPASELIVQAMDEWLVSASMPDAWKSFQHGIDRRILDRHLQQNRIEEARQLLHRGFLQRFPECDFAPPSTTAPAESFDAATSEEVKFIAQQLRQLQQPIAAARVYRSLLRRLQPDRSDFRRRPTFHRPALAVRKLSDEIDDLATELSETEPNASIDAWLEQLFPLQSSGLFFDLLVNVPEAWSEHRVDSATTQLLRRIAEHPQGKGRLDTWREQLNETDASQLARPMRLALQALLALHTENDETSSIIDSLGESLDSEEDLRSPAMLQFILIAVEASSSSDPAVVAAGGKLAALLTRHAIDLDADHHLCHLTRIMLAAEGQKANRGAQREPALSALRRRLDQLAPRRQTPLTLDAETAALLLEISQQAIQADEISLSLDAVSRALAGGPPTYRPTSASELTGLALRGGDLHRRAKTPERVIATSAASLAEQWLRFAETVDDDAVAKDIEETLLKIVLPKRQPRKLNLYLSATMGTTFEFSSAAPQPPSLISPLAKLAAQRDSVDVLRRRLERLEATEEIIIDIDTARMVLANQLSDGAAARKAAERLIDHDSLTLPAWQEMADFQPPTSPFTPTFARKKMAVQKLDLADRLLLLLPAVRSPQQESGKTKSGSVSQWHRDRDQLLLRVAGMLLSDQETRRHVLPQLDWLTGQIADRHAEKEGSETAAVARHLQTVIRAERDQEAR